uniref:Uncharacterized protein C19orf52 n=1 Tax=Aceria tosichella TaxID=561515 RepID=A0A6G1S779_9ACAR
MTTRFFGKIHLYFKNLSIDYLEVFKEVRQNARKRPLKASFYGASTLFVLNLFRANEGLRSYTSEVISACNRLGSVTENSRNPLSNEFIQQIGELNCHGVLRQIDLGFSTLIYKADANPDLALFRYHCSHLQPSFIEILTDRVVDLGLLGHWINLELKMKDYDINEEEYKDMFDR